MTCFSQCNSAESTQPSPSLTRKPRKCFDYEWTVSFRLPLAMERECPQSRDDNAASAADDFVIELCVRVGDETQEVIYKAKFSYYKVA